MSIRDNNLLRYLGGRIAIIIGIAFGIIMALGIFLHAIYFLAIPLILIIEGAILAFRPYQHFNIGFLLIAESLLSFTLLFKLLLSPGGIPSPFPFDILSLFSFFLPFLIPTTMLIGGVLGVLYEPPKRKNMPSLKRNLLLFISITVIFLIVLFGLGFFNPPCCIIPQAPGPCQVYRPNGTGTTAYINTEGVCNNPLPQYVAQFRSMGNISNIIVSNLLVPAPGVSSTLTFWMFSKSKNNGQTIFSYGPKLNGIGFGNNCFGVTNGNNTYGITSSTFQNTWVFVAASYGTNANTDKLYLNGVPFGLGVECATPVTVTASSIAYIGGTNSSYSTFNGMLANIQLYNTTLSASEINALYKEGIGGDPQNLNNLVGWWQLDGSANDYSGNLQNGIITTNVVFTSFWTSGYTAP